MPAKLLHHLRSSQCGAFAARAWPLALVAASLAIIGLSYATPPGGLDGRAPIGAYLDGALPTTHVSGNMGMPTLLSQTGAFSNTANMVPHTGLIPYDLNSPLWSDAAKKSRWIALPYDGTPASPKVGFSVSGNWTYPNGTVIVKHFGLVVNEQTNATRRLETRLLVRDANGGVYGASYRWRPDNSDAELVIAPQTEDNIVVTHADGTTSHTQSWSYPGQTQCLECHNNANAGDPNGYGTGMVLGLKTRQLNKDLTYPATGRTDNQLNTWSELGMFNTTLDAGAIAGFDKMVPLSDTTATLEKRVRSYVDSNCAYCHQGSGGPGPIWDARYTTPILNQNIAGDVTNLGAVLRRFSTDESRMYIRDGVDPRTTPFPTPMPPLARNIPHTEWLATTSAWINYPYDSVEAYSVGDSTKLRIRFNRAVDPASATLTSNYAVTNLTNAGSVTISGAAMELGDPATVVLTIAPLQTGTNYRVRINRVLETTAPYNPIWPNTFEDFVFLTSPIAQTINFAPLPDRYTRAGPFNVAATGGTSGNEVVFASLTPAICTSTGKNGRVITPTGTSGLCTVSANQDGSNTHAAAPQTTQSFKMLLAFDVVLEGSQETPPNTSPGSGGGTVTYYAPTKQLTLNLTYTGMEGTENNAHIHGPATRGVSAGIVAGLAAGSPKTDVLTLNATQETQLLAGQLYVNIHSSAYSAGELRGQIDNTGTAGKTLQVTMAGIVWSSVYVNPPAPQLNCTGLVCRQVYPANQALTLDGVQYSDDDGLLIARWIGCDTTAYGPSLSTCNMTMSTARRVTAILELAGTPAPPTISAITPGAGSAGIAFTPPGYNGGSPITGYTATCVNGASSIVASAGTSPISVPGLSNGLSYTCTVVATNAIRNSAPSNSVSVTPNPPLALLSLASSKKHNGVDYNLPLAFAALQGATVEPRTIGNSGHRLVFEFNQAITSVAGAVAKDAAMNTVGVANASFSGSTVIVTLTGVPDNQRLTVTVSGINGSLTLAPVIGFLVGDVNGSGRVTAADIAAIKSRGTVAVNAANFQLDIDTSGAINTTDVAWTRARSGKLLPP